MEKAAINDITLGFSNFADMEKFLAKWRQGSLIEVDGQKYLLKDGEVSLKVNLIQKKDKKTV